MSVITEPSGAVGGAASGGGVEPGVTGMAGTPASRRASASAI